MATTVDTLLNSLQSHLTSQTPLIPVLHAQLGLPQTALTEELNDLHSALVACVDKKIGDRRREVEEWMDKCELLERECVTLVRALGSNAKVVAGSVGELRKQQVLPKRFEYLTSHQDKLQQLYQTKLEQLSGLTNRINSLTRIVGSGFFSPEVTSLLPIPGAQNSVDAQTLRDVTPERFSRLEKELVRAKSEMSRRLVQLSQTFLQIGWLHEELGIPLPTESEIPPMAVAPSLGSQPTGYPRSCSSSSSTVDPFLSAHHSLATSTPNTSAAPNGKADTVASYHAVFSRFVIRLQEASDESLDLDGPGNEAFGVESEEPTVGLMKWAETTKNELEDLKARRESHIQSMYNELDALWRRLGVEESEMDAFVEANRGSTEENVQAYESELERMLELKRESMSIFIANARAEIENLWDGLVLGEEERGSFAPFIDDEHTEELLKLHEVEIQRLKEERRIKAPLLASIKKYFEICEEEKELAAAASDQSRLLGRGPRDPGRLLREEKMRKRVMKEKPRLEKDLLNSIPAWEDEYRRPFLINGVSIVEVLMETINAADAGKENRKVSLLCHSPSRKNATKRVLQRDRGGSVPPRGTTPQPGGMRKGAATPCPPSENFQSSQSVPNKRPRLGNSSTLNIGPRPNSVTPTFGYGPPSSSPSRPLGNKTNTPPRPRAAHAVGGGAKSGKTPTSSLPRPIPHSKYQYGTGHAHPLLASYNGASAVSYGIPRITSNTSTVSSFSIFNGIGAGKRGGRRESFKPRPSVDGPSHDMGSSLNGGGGGGRQWAAGFVERIVKEEDEY